MSNISNAWKDAQKDLHINVITPFILEVEDGRKLKYAALVVNFGLEKGTLILDTDDMSEFSTAEKYGYYCSALNPDVYGIYDRKEFIEMLEDWGYFGKEENKPSWYTGKNY